MGICRKVIKTLDLMMLVHRVREIHFRLAGTAAILDTIFMSMTNMVKSSAAVTILEVGINETKCHSRQWT